MKELEQLVTKAQGGDEQAFAQLYEISYDTVHGECLKNLHNALDAEDVTQESYVLIFRRLNQLQDPSKFLGWSRRIAHNASVDYIQHHQRKAGRDDYKPPVTSDEYQGMDEIAGEDTELSPEEQAEQKMIQELLQTAMDNISPERATSLALYQQGHSYQEISEILRIPVGTVKSHVYYAKQALRKEIEKIERREGVQIHGFTLVPLAAGGVKVEMKPAGQPKGNGFISAETAVSSSESAMKEEIGKKVLRTAGKAGTARTALWAKILAVGIAVLVIAGGIVLAVNRASKTNFATQTKTGKAGSQSVSVQAEGSAAREPITTVRNNTRPSARRQNNTGARQNAVPQETTAAATRPSQTTPQTTDSPTREIYTF